MGWIGVLDWWFDDLNQPLVGGFDWWIWILNYTLFSFVSAFFIHLTLGWWFGLVVLRI